MILREVSRVPSLSFWRRRCDASLPNIRLPISARSPAIRRRPCLPRSTTAGRSWERLILRLTRPITLFSYSAGTIQDLQTLGGPNSGALGINDSGQVAGYADLPASNGQPGPTQAFLYTGNVMTSLGSLLEGGSSFGTGINNLGAVVGDFRGVDHRPDRQARGRF